MHSLNISWGGMLLEKAKGLRMGQDVTVTFKLTGVGEPISARARVVRWEMPDRIGVKFLNLAWEDRKRIKSFVAMTVSV